MTNIVGGGCCHKPRLFMVKVRYFINKKSGEAIYATPDRPWMTVIYCLNCNWQMLLDE